MIEDVMIQLDDASLNRSYTLLLRQPLLLTCVSTTSQSIVCTPTRCCPRRGVLAAAACSLCVHFTRGFAAGIHARDGIGAGPDGVLHSCWRLDEEVL